MNSTGDSSRCNYCLQIYPNDSLRRVKLRAVEFIRDMTYQIKCMMMVDSSNLDIDYVSDSPELQLTLQYLDQNGISSIRITSRFLSITTVEQVIDYLIQTFDLSMIGENLLLTSIDRGHGEIWMPIVYDRSCTLYQLDILSGSYLRFEFNLQNKRNDRENTLFIC